MFLVGLVDQGHHRGRQLAIANILLGGCRSSWDLDGLLEQALLGISNAVAFEAISQRLWTRWKYLRRVRVEILHHCRRSCGLCNLFRSLVACRGLRYWTSTGTPIRRSGRRSHELFTFSTMLAIHVVICSALLGLMLAGSTAPLAGGGRLSTNMLTHLRVVQIAGVHFASGAFWDRQSVLLGCGRRCGRWHGTSCGSSIAASFLIIIVWLLRRLMRSCRATCSRWGRLIFSYSAVLWGLLWRLFIGLIVVFNARFAS